MYSRYVPNVQGGFDRHRVPDRTERAAPPPQPSPLPQQSPPPPPRPPQAPSSRPQQSPPPPEAAERGNGPSGAPDPRRRPGPSPPPHSGGQGPPRPDGAVRPGVPPFRPEPPRPFGPVPGQGVLSGLFGPEGALGRLFPRGLDAEELLVLAVLLLAMKQDGAGTTELLIAAALYLLL